MGIRVEDVMPPLRVFPLLKKNTEIVTIMTYLWTYIVIFEMFGEKLPKQIA